MQPRCYALCTHSNGKGVEQDYVEAVSSGTEKGEKGGKTANAGFAAVQCNLRVIYLEGKGVEQDFGKSVMWVQLAAVQGYEDALEVLDFMQQDNFIPTPLLATAVTAILLTSANAAKYNTITERVAEAPKRALACAPKTNSEIRVINDSTLNLFIFK